MRPIFFLILSLPALVLGDTIIDGPVTTTQSPSKENETIIITPSGSIEINSGNPEAIENVSPNFFDGLTVINEGVISSYSTPVIQNEGNRFTMKNSSPISGVNPIILNYGDNAKIINHSDLLASAGSDNVSNQGDYFEFINKGTMTGGSGTRVISNTGDDAFISSSGVIKPDTLALGGFRGIDNTGSKATIIVSGDILVGGGNSFGIHNTGENTRISLLGGSLIDANSWNGHGKGGVYSSADNSWISNSGTIVVREGNANGIWVESGSNAEVYNQGTILGLGPGNRGILLQSGGVIDNSGVIDMEITHSGGSYTSGITTDTVSAQIKNRGTVISRSATADGIRIFSPSTSILNSGLISVPIHSDTYAILFESSATDPALEIQSESRIIGQVDSYHPLNVEIGQGWSGRLTIQDSEGSGFGRLVVENPYVTIGNTQTIAVVDPAVFRIQSDILEDLSDSILDSIYRNQSSFLNCHFPCRTAGVMGMGSTRRRTYKAVETKNHQGGFLAGADFNFCSTNSLGVFVGGAWAEGRVKNNLVSNKTRSYFGGVSYEGMWSSTFVAATVSAGYFGSDIQRTVMYNLTPNGEQIAKTSPSGSMVTAEIYAARYLFPTCFFSPVLSGSLRYAGVFLGDYKETGSSADFSVENRKINLIKPKIDMGISVKKDCCNTTYEFIPYVGVAGRFQTSGNSFDGVLLDKSLEVKTGGPKSLAEILYGVTASLTTNYFELFFNIQGLRDNKNSSRLIGEGRVSFSF